MWGRLSMTRQQRLQLPGTWMDQIQLVLSLWEQVRVMHVFTLVPYFLPILYALTRPSETGESRCFNDLAGTNACYVEQLGNIHKWLPQFRPRTSDMVVNIEWPGMSWL